MVEDRENEQSEYEEQDQLPEPVEPYPQHEEEDESDEISDAPSDEAEVEEFEGDFEEDDDLEIAEETSHLASHPGRNMIMLVVIVIASAIALYFILFSGEDGSEKKEEEESQTVSTKEVRDATQETFVQAPDVGAVDAPAAPQISDIEIPDNITFDSENANVPNAPEINIPFDDEPPDFFDTAEPVVEIPEEEEVEITLPADPSLPEDDGDLPSAPGLEPIPGGADLPTPEEQAAANAKRRSGIMLLNGGSGNEDGEGGGSGLFGGGAAANAIDSNVPQLTSATQSVATTIGANLNSVIAQGKMIDAVLETAVNTDLPGVLRAIVSRDVYAESGKKILVPKGSRLIGNYEAELEAGQTRVFVVWTRIIRPDGIDVIIDSPGVDPLGRAGVAGVVDDRFMEIFGNAVLLSALTVAGAYVLETVTGATETTSTATTGADGSSSETSTGTPTSFAISEAATDLSDTAADIVEGTINTQPRITVAQGTRIKVFVNSDLIFPSSVSQNVRFIN